MEGFTYAFRMGDLSIALLSELPLSFESDSAVFFCPSEAPDVVYHIHQGDTAPKGQVLYKRLHYTVYGQDDLRERVFSFGTNVLKLSYHESTPHVFYLCGEKSVLQGLSNVLIRNFFALEIPFLQSHSFLLHASVVQYEGNAIAFSAPSGTGKSTQAALWQEVLGAEILNGDRTLVRNFEKSVMAYGSVFSGSSGIYKNACAPLRMVVFLEQAPTNQLCPISKGQAFIRLYKETLNNPWSASFTETLTRELEAFLQRTPVFLLRCRPDHEAVHLVRDKFLSLTTEA